MQWNWLVRTKLLLAALALVVVLGDSEAGPFRNRRNNQENGQWMMVDQTPAMTTPAGQPTTPATASTQTQEQGQWVSQPQGRRGRRSVMVWQPTQVVQQQPQPGPGAQPAVGQPVAGQPGTEPAPMPSTTPTPTVQSGQPVQQQPVVAQRRGLFGRRAARNDNGGYTYTPDSTAGTQPGTTRQSFYPANGQGALIDVRVPIANAEITFDGVKTNQQGTNRLFSTPALNPQAANTYEVKARWTGQDGNPVEQTRTVKAPPGGRILVDFTIQQP